MSDHYNNLLSGVNVGDGKDNVLAALSSYSPVVEDKRVTITCPKSTSSYLYVTFDDNYRVKDKGISGAVGRTWRMLCQMPRVNDSLSEDTVPEEEGVDPVVAVKRGAELLEPLKDRCLTYAGGWWTFEYCHNQYVRQFHALGPDKSGNTQEIEFRLGLHSKRMELYDDEKVRRIGRSRYLTQVWGGGTLCDMTREPRDIEIEYHCDPHGPERIAMVEEVEVCSYAMIINTPRLCADPMFYDTAASAVYDIKCQHVLADAEYSKVMADRAALRLQMDSAEPGAAAAAAAADDDDEVPLAQVLASSASTKKKEKDAQVVVSMNDPELGQLSKGSQEKLRKLMAIAYDAPQLRVRFAEAATVKAQSSIDDEDERKGGGGGRPGGGGGGGGKPSGSKPSGSKPGGSGNSVGSGSSKPSLSGGGGSGGKGSGSMGDRPPSYGSLYPDRSGVNAGGKGSGSGDSSRPYGPPPAYTANAQYTTVNRGQTVQTHTFASKSPAVYYASPMRSTYPGAWGYGFYPIFPYPWWAYGGGVWVGSTYYGNSYSHGVHNYKAEFRNITVVNATSIPLIGDIDLFDNKSNVTLTDFNNGTIRVAPCGNSTSDKLKVDAKDCDFIVLDLRLGSVVAGNARAQVLNEVTFFNLTLGSRTALLRTQTISSTKKTARGGIIAGIVLGSIGFVAL
ncbi:Protein OS-9 [Coemansia sp. S146]|nr:Protein OS-9 [Coemansia sp. S146]